MANNKIIIFLISILLIATVLPTVSSTDGSFIYEEVLNSKIGGKSLNNIAQSRTLNINNQYRYIIPQQHSNLPNGIKKLRSYQYHHHQFLLFQPPIYFRIRDCGS